MLSDRHLNVKHKRGICQFLEEALCNVGKHAQGATRLEVLCQQSDGRNMVRVTDHEIGCSKFAETV